MSIEGLVFYWVAWFFWIITTFFMNKLEKYRFSISLCILLAIILKSYNVTEYQVNGALVFLYCFSILHIVKQKKLSVLYIFICALIIMMAYASFLLFELYDPIWIFLDRKWLLGVTLGYVCVLLHENIWNRFFILVIGMIQGETIYSFVLRNVGLHYSIGSGRFFDVLATSMFVIFIWKLAEVIIMNLDQYLDSHIRGKQKST